MATMSARDLELRAGAEKRGVLCPCFHAVSYPERQLWVKI